MIKFYCFDYWIVFWKSATTQLLPKNGILFSVYQLAFYYVKSSIR